MKASIQPKYYQATVTCNCGNTFVTGSTKPEIHVEVCSKCHSFYTGTQKTAAAKGRIDKFNKKYGYNNEDICSDYERQGGVYSALFFDIRTYTLYFDRIRARRTKFE